MDKVTKEKVLKVQKHIHFDSRCGCYYWLGDMGERLDIARLLYYAAFKVRIKIETPLGFRCTSLTCVGPKHLLRGKRELERYKNKVKSLNRRG